MVSQLRLGTWRIDRLRQLVAFLQSLRQCNPTDYAVFLIACPAASRNVSADNALNRKHLQFFAEHAVPVKFRFPEKIRHIVHIYADHVIGHNILCIVKPEPGHLGENLPLTCHLIFQYDIKG